MVTAYIVLSVLMTLLLCFGQQGTASFYPTVKGRKTNCAEKDNDVKLICKSNTSVSTMVIKKAHDGKVLYTSSEVSTSAEFLIEEVGCKDMGEYQCIIDNKKAEFTTLVLSDCPPMPCRGENTAMAVYADINTDLQTSFCILIYKNFSSFIDIDNVRVKRKTEVNSNWTWDYLQNTETPACFRNVTIALTKRKFTSEDYGKINIRVYSLDSRVLYLEYNMSFMPPVTTILFMTSLVDEAQFSQSTTTAKNQPLVEQDVDLDVEEVNGTQEDIITFLPPFLVIVLAVALTVVMIIRKEKRNKQREASKTSTKEQIISGSTDL